MVGFGEDFKQGWAPADFMRELQSRGRITDSFTAIAWRGPGQWFDTCRVGRVRSGHGPRVDARGIGWNSIPNRLQ